MITQVTHLFEESQTEDVSINILSPTNHFNQSQRPLIKTSQVLSSKSVAVRSSDPRLKKKIQKTKSEYVTRRPYIPKKVQTYQDSSFHQNHSSLAKAKAQIEQYKDLSQRTSTDQQLGFADQLLRRNEEKYNRQFKFERAHFHQCITNPVKRKEFITVQISTHVLKEVQNDQSIADLKRLDFLNDVDDLRDQKIFQRYKPAQTHDNRKKQTADLDGKSKQIETELHADMVLSEQSDEDYSSEVAIIGFWKQDEQGQFKCYRHFNVPNPMKRQIRESPGAATNISDMKLCDILYTGSQSEVFFFFKKNEQMNLGIINDDLTDDESNPEKCSAQFELFPVLKTSTLSVFITYLNDKIIPAHKFIPSPTLFRNFLEGGDASVVFTTYWYDKPKAASGHKSPSIFFYNIEQQKEVIQIPNAVTILKCNPETTEVTFLACEKDKHFPALVNTIEVNFERVNQSQKPLRSIELNFDHWATLYEKQNPTKIACNLIEACLHNDDKRLTLTLRDQCAFTFLLPKFKDVAQRMFPVLDSTDAVNIVTSENGKDVYVTGHLQTHEDGRSDKQPDCYLTASLIFYNVSDEVKEPDVLDKKVWSSPHDEKAAKCLRLPSTFKCHFKLHKRFAQSYSQESKCLVKIPRPMITSDKEIIGAIFFEETNHSGIKLNWYFTGLEQVDNETIQIPSFPLEQTWKIDYPMLAYKTKSPSNQEIALVHLAQDMPQRIFDIHPWEFIYFVEQGTERNQIDCSILFLAKHQNHHGIRLLMLKVDPWKRTEINTPFNMPERIFRFKQPVILPQSTDEGFKKNLFTPDKIRNVLTLQNEPDRKSQTVLSLQYAHCILTSSLNSMKYTIHIELQEMAGVNQIRGDNDLVFYGKYYEDRDVIVSLWLHDKLIDKLVTKEIYETQDRLIGLQKSLDYSKVIVGHDPVKQFCILTSTQQVKTIKQSPNKKDLYAVDKETDFSGHDMSSLMHNQKSLQKEVYISHQAITKGVIVFKANQNTPGAVKGSKSYNWWQQCPTDRKPTSTKKAIVMRVQGIQQISSMLAIVEQTSKDTLSDETKIAGQTWKDFKETAMDFEFLDSDQYQDLNPAQQNLVNELIDIQAKQQKGTGSGLEKLVSQRDRSRALKETFFIIKPEPGSRIHNLTRFETETMMVQRMLFITNDHILVQFLKKAVPLKEPDGRVVYAGDQNCNEVRDQLSTVTVIFKTNGKIVNQDEEVDQVLKGQIIGMSQLLHGKRTLVLRSENGTPMNQVSVVSFDQSGIAYIVSEFLDLEEQVIKQINGHFEENELLSDQTIINDKSWAELKDQIQAQANDQEKDLNFTNYKKTEYKQLTLDEQDKVNALIARQGKSQDALLPLPYRFAFFNEILVTQSAAGMAQLVMIGRIQKPVTPTDEAQEKNSQSDEKLRPDQKTPSSISAYEMKAFEVGNEKDENVKVIILTQEFDGEHKNMKDLHDLLQFELVGPYLAYRSKTDHNINITEIASGNGEQKPKFVINLNHIVTNKNDLQFVNFFAVPENFFQSFKMNKQNGEMLLYEHLLQVTVRTKHIIFNMSYENPRQNSIVDKFLSKQHRKALPSPQEINFIEDFHQLMDPETLVSTGFVHTIEIKPNENVKVGFTKTVQMNEHMTLYLVEEYSKQQQGSNLGKIKHEVLKTGSQFKINYAGNLYRTCSEIDMLCLAQVQVELDNKEQLSNIDMSTILSTYDGHNIFSVYWEHLQVYKKIAEQLNQQEFKDEIYQKKKFENNQLRLLYRVVLMPCMDLKPVISKEVVDRGTFCNQCQGSLKEIKHQQRCQHKVKSCWKLIKHWQKSDDGNKQPCKTQCRGFKPMTRKSVYYSNGKFRDSLIQILTLCAETEIRSFINVFDELKELFDRLSPAVHEFLKNATFQTNYCKKIDVLKFNPETVKHVVRSRRTYVDAKYLQNLITKGDDDVFERLTKKLRNFITHVKGDNRQTISVEVEMLSTSWIFRNYKDGDGFSFKYFIKCLEEQASDEMHQDDVVITIVDEFWSMYMYTIFFVCFIPFVFYFFTTIHFFSIQRQLLLTDEEDHRAAILQLVIFIGTVYFTLFQIRQIFDNKLRYFFSIQNWVENFSTGINLLIIVKSFSTVSDYDEQIESFKAQQTRCSIAVALMWYRLFKWMRLFTTLSYYVRLLTETIQDICYFLILFVLVIAAAANMLYITNELRIYEGGDEIFSSRFNQKSIDSFIYVYLLSLGEFDYDRFISSEDQDISEDQGNNLWIIFLVATFLIQITFLNMLIAIMGNTYDKVIDKSNEATMRERIELLSEYRDVLELHQPSFQYFFIVKPSNASEQCDQQWQGRNSAIKSQIERSCEKMSSEVTSKIAKLENQVQIINSKNKADINIVRSEVNKINTTIKKNKQDFQRNIDGLNQHNEEVIKHNGDVRKHNEEVDKKLHQFESTLNQIQQHLKDNDTNNLRALIKKETGKSNQRGSTVTPGKSPKFYSTQIISSHRSGINQNKYINQETKSPDIFDKHTLQKLKHNKSEV